MWVKGLYSGTEPVARGGATGPPPPRTLGQGPLCKFEEKKLHQGPVAPGAGDQGIFSKFFETDIYF